MHHKPMAPRNRAFRLTALAAALACLPAMPGWAMAGGVPSAIAEAYLGAATPEKLAAALAGIKPLIRELPLITPPGPCWYCFFGAVEHDGSGAWGGINLVYTPIESGTLTFATPQEQFWVGSDADLAPLGTPALLANTHVTLTASFETARDFVIGNPAYGAGYQPQSTEYRLPLLDENGVPIAPQSPPRPYSAGPGYIDSNGHDLKITGVLTSHQTLYKEGAGTLWLTGANVWNAAPVVLAGVLKGDSASLDSAIRNHAQVEFRQESDGTYRHAMEGSGGLLKSGIGTLAVSGEQKYTGGTVVAEGTLALTEWGKLAPQGTLRIDAAGTLDLTGVWTDPVLASLSGTGRVVLGERGLTLDSTEGLSFDGAIQGDGPLTLRGGSAFTLGGDNSFSGGLKLAGATLRFSGAANLGAGTVTLDNGVLQALATAQLHQALRTDSYGGVDSNGHDLTWSGPIAGTGFLSKLGEGSLSLAGDNAFTGQMVVEQGILKLVGAGHLDHAGSVIVQAILDLGAADGPRRIQRLEGYGSVRLGNQNLVLGADDAYAHFTGGISGSGGLTKVGNGTQILTGANSYAGPTTILGGTLKANAQSLGGQQVINHATLEIEQNGGLASIAAWSGDIEGSGRLVKSGDGVLWLRGRNSYSGGTRVDAGVLMGNTHSLQGDIETHAGLAFYQVENGTYAGRVSGSGTLMSHGPGSLTLTGINTHTGGTAFSNTLRVARDENLGGPQSGLLIAGGTLQALDHLVLNRHVALGEAGASFDSNGYDIRLNGRIDGPGGVRKLGEGTLFLAGEHGYTGPTVVEQGRMVVNGRFAGDVQVLSGAAFEAKGGIAGNLNLAGGALFSPGNSPGTLEIGGDFLADGEILIEIAGTDSFDRVLVGGTAHLAGAHIRFAFLDGYLPAATSSFSFLTAAGGYTGLDQVSYAYGAGMEGYEVRWQGDSLSLFSPAAVPEPETYALLLAGLGLVGYAARRRRRRG